MFKQFINIYKFGGFDFTQAKEEISFLLDIEFNYTYKDFLFGRKLDDKQILSAQKIFKERVSTHKPIQQIVGKSYFFGHLFYVNEFTLIPRPETELLVKEVSACSKQFKHPKILDIGCGTGCIGLSLMLENKDIQCDLVDIQTQALEIAKKNSLLHNIKSGVRFIQSDIFENINEKYDIIVSNPPYIPIKDKETLQIEVGEFESPIALFAGDSEGIEFYEKIITNAEKYLKKGGMLAFEIGINQCCKVSSILRKNNYSQIKVIKDFNSMERVISAKSSSK